MLSPLPPTRLLKLNQLGLDLLMEDKLNQLPLSLMLEPRGSGSTRGTSDTGYGSQSRSGRGSEWRNGIETGTTIPIPPSRGPTQRFLRLGIRASLRLPLLPAMPSSRVDREQWEHPSQPPSVS